MHDLGWCRVAWLGLVIVLMLPACDSDGVVIDPAVEITLLAVYTPAAADAAGDIGSVLRRAVADANAAYLASGVPIRLRLVHTAPVPFASVDRLTDLRRLVRPDDGVLDGVHTLRDQHAADVVVLVPDDRTATINAAVLARPETAFLVVHWDALGAPAYGLAHELGHLQGARHDPISDPLDVPFSYGHAVRTDRVQTIMGAGAAPRVGFFAAPGRTYRDVALGDTTTHDVARVLRETARTVASFRGRPYPTDFEPPGTWPVVTFFDEPMPRPH